MQDDHLRSSMSRLDATAQIAIIIGIICSVLIGVSRRAGNLIMGMIKVLVSTTLPPGDESDLPHQIPSSIVSAADKFNLRGKLTFYAVCTTCKCIHKPSFGHSDKEKKYPIYPKECTNIPNPGGPQCGTLLLERVFAGGIHVWRPILTYAYHDFKDFVASLDARVEIREAMDLACDKAMSSNVSGSPTELKDVLSGSFARTFKGPDSKLFIDRPEGEGRLLFSLNLDFFTTEGMRISGAKDSTGVLAMACLNLPIDIRYKPHNMYIAGIIPGPHEPILTQSNHFIKPLIDDMTAAWERGILYTHVPGRLVRCAIACAVCDLPGARKLASLAGVNSHHFCTVCECYGRSHIGRLDYENWISRDPNVLRKNAEDWRDASSISKQKLIFSSHGVRWSELWRLPYWNPSIQLVIDPMHCLLEGLVDDHFRDTLGLTSVEAETKDDVLPAFQFDFVQAPDKMVDPENPIFDVQSEEHLSDNEIQHVPIIHDMLRHPLENLDEDALQSLKKKLSRCNLRPLEFVARSLGFTPTGEQLQGRMMKKLWLEPLIEWVRIIVKSLRHQSNIICSENLSQQVPNPHL